MLIGDDNSPTHAVLFGRTVSDTLEGATCSCLCPDDLMRNIIITSTNALLKPLGLNKTYKKLT